MEYNEVFTLRHELTHRFFYQPMDTPIPQALDWLTPQWYQVTAPKLVEQAYEEIVQQYGEQKAFHWFSLVATEYFQQEAKELNEQADFQYDLELYLLSPTHHSFVCNGYPIVVIDVRKKEMIESFDGYFYLTRDWNAEKEKEWKKFYKQIGFFSFFVYPFFSKALFYTHSPGVKSFIESTKRKNKNELTETIY